MCQGISCQVGSGLFLSLGHDTGDVGFGDAAGVSGVRAAAGGAGGAPVHLVCVGFAVYRLLGAGAQCHGRSIQRPAGATATGRGADDLRLRHVAAVLPPREPVQTHPTGAEIRFQLAGRPIFQRSSGRVHGPDAAVGRCRHRHSRSAPRLAEVAARLQSGRSNSRRTGPGPARHPACRCPAAHAPDPQPDPTGCPGAPSQRVRRIPAPPPFPRPARLACR